MKLKCFKLKSCVNKYIFWKKFGNISTTTNSSNQVIVEETLAQGNEFTF